MFWIGILLSAGLFAVGRLVSKKGSWDAWDYARAAIPGLAFVLWTILQKTTAFDALAPDKLSNGGRLLIGLTGAVVLGGVAALLGIKADKAAALPATKANRARPSQGG